MKFIRLFPILLFLLVTVFHLNACSNDKTPIEPGINDDQAMSRDIPNSQMVQSETHSMITAYEARIDPVEKTFTLTASDRNSQYKFPLTSIFPNILQITDYGWTPNFWADIKLVHPFPGSGINVFDPRVIAILPAKPGVSMNYPISDIQANNSVVLEPDGYTKMFDSEAPLIPGNANPFLAYFKNEPFHMWSSTGTTEETKHWQMDLSGFDGPLVFKLVVEASTNYPSPPLHGVDNTPEPVQVEIEIGDGLRTDGGIAAITVMLLDWRFPENIKCEVESPELFDGTVELLYSHPGPNAFEYVFEGTISNDLGASEEDYSVLIAACDISTDIYIFKEGTATVRDIIFNPIDVTPPWLNISPVDVYIDGNYAYVAGGLFGLHIFDISNPENPVWINQVDTTDVAQGVYVANGYAYVADGISGLQIIDVTPPESAYIFNTIDTSFAERVYVTEGFAYIIDKEGNEREILIVDIEPPESAHIVIHFNPQDLGPDICVAGEYAYVPVNYPTGLRIIDIDPPESAHVVNTVFISGYVRCVDICGNFVYVVGTDGLHIIDVETPLSAYIVDTVNTSTHSDGIFATDGLAYVLHTDYSGKSGMQIVDVNLPASAFILSSLDVAPCLERAFVSGGYAYLACAEGGFQVIDVDPPESPGIVKSIDTPGFAYEVHVTDGYAYVANGNAGLQIIDIDPIENTYAVKSVNTDGSVVGVYESEGYAYAVDSHGLQIIDVDPPESAYVVSSVATLGYSDGVHVSGNYAYIVNGWVGLKIIDIDPPQNAYVVKTVNTTDYSYGVYEIGGYAYVTGYDYEFDYSGLQIVDVDPPGNARIVKSIDMPKVPENVYVTGDYAYVASRGYGLQIMDINPPSGANIVKSVDTPGLAYGLCVFEGYAFVADGNAGLQIIDVYSPGSAYIIDSIDTPGSARDVNVEDGYAYVAARDGGLRIIDLW